MIDPAAAAQRISEAIRQVTGLSTVAQTKVLTSLLIVLLLALLRTLTIRVNRSRVTDLRARYRWRKTITYITVVVGLLLVGRVWFSGVHDLLSYLGIVSAGVAIALRDPIVNLAGWVFISWRRPFVVGDRIALGEHSGDVIDQRVFQFTLLEIGGWVAADQSTGRIIHIPNGKVFTEPLANYTRGFQYIWNEIPVLVTFESDWRKAKEILLDIAAKRAEQLSEDAERRILQATRKFMIFYSTLTPTVYTSVADSGVLLTIRYLCEPRRRRGTAEQIWEDILDAFSATDDIDFAYPTTRYYDNIHEGKPGARAEPMLGGEAAPPSA